MLNFSCQPACGGLAEPTPSARGQKISSPKTPPFFARSPKFQPSLHGEKLKN